MQLREDTKIYYDDTPKLQHELRSLRKYNMVGYKQIIFKDRIIDLEFNKVNNDLYVADLKTDRIFKDVYGTCQVYATYNDENNSIKVLYIEPSDLLLAGFMKTLNTYVGTPYRDSKDLFKIKLALAKERQERK
jgi:hypothetical protein